MKTNGGFCNIALSHGLNWPKVSSVLFVCNFIFMFFFLMGKSLFYFVKINSKDGIHLNWIDNSGIKRDKGSDAKTEERLYEEEDDESLDVF